MEVRQMTSFSLQFKILFAAFGVWALLMYASASSPQPVLAEGLPTPTPSGESVPTTVQKQIVLRTEQGERVPGIDVQLAPADPTLGGPNARAQIMTTTTDLQGIAKFTGLGQWLWMVSFTGTFRGKALQPASEQGRAPYGRTRAGGGFPVMVQRQEEDTSATPLVIQGVQQPEVQPSLFVLVPVQDHWAPSLDLALPEEHPISISGAVGAPSPSSSTTPVVNIAAAASTGGRAQGVVPATDGESGLDSLVRWFYILPLGVALIALYRTWQDRKQNNLQRWSCEAGSDDVDHSEDQL